MSESPNEQQQNQKREQHENVKWFIATVVMPPLMVILLRLLQ